MNIVNIIEGIERLVVSMLFWIIFIPKTVFKIVSDPKWVEEYVTLELKQDTDRFKDYMSPIILYLLNSVFLIFVYIFIKRDILKDLNFSSEAEAISIWDKIVPGLDITGDMITTLSGSYGFVAATIFLSIPLFFGLILVFFKRQGLSREELKRATYIQCYYFTPLALTFSLIILSSSLLGVFEQYLIGINFLIFFIWFSMTQTKFIAKEIRKKTFPSFLIYSGILLGTIVCTILIISIFNAFDEDKSKILGAEIPLPSIIDSTVTEVNYSIVVKCPDCKSNSTDSLIIDAVLTRPVGIVDNREFKFAPLFEDKREFSVSSKYKTLKLEISEDFGRDLYIHVWYQDDYTITGGINSKNAILIRRIISYVLIVLLGFIVIKGFISLIKKEYIK